MSAERATNLRRIGELAWPVLVGQLAVVGFSTIDTLLVARFARDDLAALSVGAAAYITVFIGLAGVVLALGPIVGQQFGAGRLEPAGRQLHQAAWLAVGLSVVGALLLVFPQPFLAIAQAPPEVEHKLRGYLIALAVALPAALLVQAYRGFNNAISRPKAVMALQIGGLVAKVPLTALLVFGWPAVGLPGLGVLGCGVATAIVMWLMAGLALLVLRRDRFYDRFALRGRGWDRPDRRALGAQLRLGLPMGLSILIEVSGFAFMAIFIARLGVVPSAGHQIASNLTALMFMVPLALANATTTLVAQRIGAADLADARRLGWHGVQAGTAIALVMAAALMLGREWIARRYSTDAAVLAVAVPLLGWLALFHVADAMQVIAAFVLRAYRIVTLPMLIYAGSLWGVGMGGGYWLAFHPPAWAPTTWHGAAGYWVAASAGLIVSGIALVALLHWTVRRMADDLSSPAAA